MKREWIQRASFVFRVLTRRKIDLLDQIEADHVRLEVLFFQWRFATHKEPREVLFRLIQQEIVRMMHLKEVLFYPTCQKYPRLKNFVSESKADHHHFKALLKDVAQQLHESASPSSKMKTLMKEVSEYITREENKFFPEVKDVMKSTLLYKLGREYRLSKQSRHTSAAA